MSDVRLRIASLFLVSAAVYFLPETAILAVFWLLVFSGLSGKQLLRAASAALLIALVPTAVLFFSFGAAALVYGGKTAVLLLLAFWFGQTCRAGEFQSLFVWLFGNRFGFDFGMVAEILLMQASIVLHDAKGYRQALAQKNKTLNLKTFPAFAFGILMLALRRAERSAKLLARRGYAGGGTYRPEFSPEKKDVLQLVFAAGVLLIGLF